MTGLGRIIKVGVPVITIEELRDEMAAIIRSYVSGLSTREQAIGALAAVDPVARGYMAPDAYLESLGL
jgi:hypothetical protein